MVKKNNLRIHSAVSTEYRRVTNRQTNRETSCDGIVRAMHMRRTVKTKLSYLHETSSMDGNGSGIILLCSPGDSTITLQCRSVSCTWKANAFSLFAIRYSLQVAVNMHTN